jgi:hypothetical protein
MESDKLIEELIDSIEDEKQKRIAELFKGKHDLSVLKAEIEKQIEEDLNET